MLTEGFIAGLRRSPELFSVFPADQYPSYSPHHILNFFDSIDSVLIIAFSAGVVGAIATARIWQRQGVRIAGFIAIDGWGVPLAGEFPIHRVSHDQFTHWSSLMLGGNAAHFYADPAVDHLTLWHSPETVLGRIEPSNRIVSAATFIGELIEHYTLD